MYLLIRTYFENGDETTEVVLRSEDESKVIERYDEELQKDKDFGYVEDLEYNKEYCVRLFLDYQENWNDYIEMYIIKK